MKKSNTKVNLLYNMIYQILIIILPLITTPYIARVIGVEGVGIYSYWHAIALYFVYFSMLGISNYGNRSIARVRDDVDARNEMFSSIYTLQLITSSIVITIYIIYVFCFVSTNRNVALLVIFHVLSAMFDISWLFFGLEEFKITVIRQIFIRVATLVLIFTFVKTKDDLGLYIFIMSIGYFVSALILWGLAWKRVSWKRVSWKKVFNHLKPCLVLFIPIIATSIYRVMDKIMLGTFTSMEVVGYYESAEKLLTIPMGLISSFSAVMMPKMSNLLGKGEEKAAKNLFNTSMEMAMCIGIAIAFGIVSISKEFIPIFFGEGYEASIYLTNWLAISIPFISWANIIRVVYLIPAEKDKIYLRSIILGAVLNVVCNFILIPKVGAMGAVMGTLLAEGSVAIYQTVKVRNYLEVKRYVKQLCIFMIFGSIMMGVVYLVSQVINPGIVALIIEVACGGIVYVGCSFSYLIIKNPTLIKGINLRKLR